MSWRLFLSIAWLGPLLYIFNRMYLRRSGYGWQVVREGFTRVSTNLAENITGVRVVTAFNRQLPNLDEFNKLQDVNTANNIQVSRLNGLYQPALGLIGLIGRIIIIAYGGYLVIARPSVITVGSVVGALGYWDWFMNPIVQIGNWYNVYMQAMAGGERVFDLLDTKPDVEDAPDAQPLPRIDGYVTFERRGVRLQRRAAGAPRRELRSQARSDDRARRRHRQRQEQHHLADQPVLSAPIRPRAGRRTRHPARHRRQPAPADGPRAAGELLVPPAP